jgi:hypothetical protein
MRAWILYTKQGLRYMHTTSLQVFFFGRYVGPVGVAQARRYDVIVTRSEFKYNSATHLDE